eukprot:scaffold455_cov116-Isochrysis_galbana.AAC.9
MSRVWLLEPYRVTKARLHASASAARSAELHHSGGESRRKSSRRRLASSHSPGCGRGDEDDGGGCGADAGSDGSGTGRCAGGECNGRLEPEGSVGRPGGYGVEGGRAGGGCNGRLEPEGSVGRPGGYGVEGGRAGGCGGDAGQGGAPGEGATHGGCTGGSAGDCGGGDVSGISGGSGGGTDGGASGGGGGALGGGGGGGGISSMRKRPILTEVESRSQCGAHPPSSQSMLSERHSETHSTIPSASARTHAATSASLIGLRCAAGKLPAVDESKTRSMAPACESVTVSRPERPKTTETSNDARVSMCAPGPYSSRAGLPPGATGLRPRFATQPSALQVPSAPRPVATCTAD